MNRRPLIRIIHTAAIILSSVLYLLTVFSAYGGCVDPSTWSFPSMLTLAFPFFMAGTIVLGIIWLILRSYEIATAALAAFLVCLGPILNFSPIGHSSEAKKDEKTFTLMSYNIYYGIDRENHHLPYSPTMSYILNSGADVVCLQEMYNLSRRDNPVFPDSQIDSLRHIYPYTIETTQYNVMAMSKYPIRRLPTPFQYDINYLFYDAYEIDIEGTKITIFNMHLNSYNLSGDERNVATELNSIQGVRHGLDEMKSSIYSKLATAFRVRAASATEVSRFANTIDGNLIICGDFNDVPGSWVYRKIKGKDLHDAFTETYFGPMITFNAHRLYFHIDHVLYRGNLKALNMKRGNLKTSDHYPLITTFAITTTAR